MQTQGVEPTKPSAPLRRGWLAVPFIFTLGAGTREQGVQAPSLRCGARCLLPS